jgi:hypothetical protein
MRLHKHSRNLQLKRPDADSAEFNEMFGCDEVEFTGTSSVVSAGCLDTAER